MARLGGLLASEEAAKAWVEEVAASWPVGGRHRRALALQKLSGVILTLEDLPYDLAFASDERAVVNATFEKFFGVAVEGPLWRLQPGEERLPWSEMSDDFTPEPDGSERLQELLARPVREPRLPPEGIGPEWDPAPQSADDRTDVPSSQEEPRGV